MRKQIEHWLVAAKVASPQILRVLTVAISLYSLKYLFWIVNWCNFYALNPEQCCLPGTTVGRLKTAACVCAVNACVIAFERMFALFKGKQKTQFNVADFVMFVIAAFVTATMFMLDSIRSSGFMVWCIK